MTGLAPPEPGLWGHAELILGILAATGPIAVLIVGWLLKRAINNLDQDTKEAKGKAEAAKIAADAAQHDVDLIKAAGPYQRADLCVPLHQALLDGQHRIEGLIQGLQAEAREDRGKLWAKIDSMQERLKALETRMEERHVAR